MTDQQIELERLAKLSADEGGFGEPWYNQYYLCSKDCLITATDGNFIAAATPKTILYLIADIRRLEEALKDMLSGWEYIRESHGDLYGVGWDRAQEKAEKALGINTSSRPD